MPRVRAVAVVGLLLVCACGDRAPPALWPEPPPPTLAHPIGVEDPQSFVATGGGDAAQPVVEEGPSATGGAHPKPTAAADVDDGSSGTGSTSASERADTTAADASDETDGS